VGAVFTVAWSLNGSEYASIRGWSQRDLIVLAYRYRAEDLEYPVQLGWTSCNFGGERPWFLCPAVGCGRRVAILYGGRVFACRHCYKLAYPSQRENDFDRQARRVNKIRARLGWQPGILNRTGWKPKRMHWKTFRRLRAEHDELIQPLFTAMLRSLGLDK